MAGLGFDLSEGLDLANLFLNTGANVYAQDNQKTGSGSFYQNTDLTNGQPPIEAQPAKTNETVTVITDPKQSGSSTGIIIFSILGIAAITGMIIYFKTAK